MAPRLVSVNWRRWDSGGLAGLLGHPLRPGAIEEEESFVQVGATITGANGTLFSYSVPLCTLLLLHPRTAMKQEERLQQADLTRAALVSRSGT